MLKVAAAIIQQGDQFLICQRPEGKHLAFFWEFPGGKVEVGETFAECLVRECREELGIEIKIQSLFAKTAYDYPEYSIQFAFFCCQIECGDPRPQEQQVIRWVKRTELKDYAFCPADDDVIKKLGLPNE